MSMEFIFSREMQIIHIVNSFVTNTLIMYLIANLLLKAFDEKASVKQKFIFAFITGTLFQTAYVYLIYFIGGAMIFTPLVYILLTTPNPVFALLYCISGIKVLKLSSIRSIKLSGYIFLFFLLLLNFNRLLEPIFFAQTSERYNYLLAMWKQTVFFLTAVAAYLIVQHQIKSKKYLLRFSDKVFINTKKELFVFFLRVLFFYLLIAILPILIQDQIIVNSVIVLILSLFLALAIFVDVSNFYKTEIENKAVHISALSNGITEFSSIKHDFYNILQTYSGYLHVGNIDKLKEYHTSLLNVTTDAGKSMELGRRMSENPALISLLINKSEYADKMDVKMTMSLQCSLETLYIDNMDICRCISGLLDNAIESAAESEQKKVFFTIEYKKGGTKLIIITNSTPSDVDVNKIMVKGFSSKKKHIGLGLANVHKILDSYGNCTVQIDYYNYEFSVYIELKKA